MPYVSVTDKARTHARLQHLRVPQKYVGIVRSNLHSVFMTNKRNLRCPRLAGDDSGYKYSTLVVHRIGCRDVRAIG